MYDGWWCAERSKGNLFGPESEDDREKEGERDSNWINHVFAGRKSVLKFNQLGFEHSSAGNQNLNIVRFACC